MGRNSLRVAGTAETAPATASGGGPRLAPFGHSTGTTGRRTPGGTSVPALGGTREPRWEQGRKVPLVVKRDIGKLTDETFDLLVVGGGVFGVCAAWEAASRGLSVALVEKGDFAEATSSNSYKIAHGGIRYLQHGDIARVRGSCRERSALLRVAPHLVQPLPILVPTYGRGTRGKAFLRVGFFLYELLTSDRNRGISDPERRIPRATSLSREKALQHFPDLPERGLTGGVVFCDGQMYSPPRLALSFLRSADEAGAEVANYVEVVGFTQEGARVTGVRARDRLGGRDLEIRAATTLNATGPWAHHLLRDELDLRLGPDRPTFSRDVGLVTRRRLHSDFGLACPTVSQDAEAVLDRGGRHLFLLPWRDRTLVGVWHGVYEASPDEVEVTLPELEAYVDEANEAYPGLGLSVDDVTMVNTGLILFGNQDHDESAHSFGKRSVLVDHAERHDLAGLVTVIGVRATMARGVAERAIDLVIRKRGLDALPSRTESTPVFGGNFDRFESLVSRVEDRLEELSGRRQPSVARSLAHNYGTEHDRVLKLVQNQPRLARTLGDSNVLRAEVVHAAREEMAAGLEDVVLRRTDLGTAAHPGEEAVATCASLLAEELGWSDARRGEEIADLDAFFARRGALRRYTTAMPASA